MRGELRGRLEKAGEQRRLGEVHLAHRLAEVELRGRLDTEGPTAKIGAVEVELENFTLAETRLQEEGQKSLFDLALQGSARKTGTNSSPAAA